MQNLKYILLATLPTYIYTMDFAQQPRPLTQLDRIENELRELAQELKILSSKLNYQEAHVESSINELRGRLNDRLNTVEGLLLQRNENKGDTPVERARLAHQFNTMRRALQYYRSGNLELGHQLLRASQITDSQSRDYTRKLVSIPTTTTTYHYNSNRLWIAASIAAAGLLSFIDYDEKISARPWGQFDMPHGLWLIGSETAAGITALTGIYSKKHPNTIPLELIQQVEDYLNLLESAINN